MKAPRPIPYLRVQGSSYEMGRQHGRACAPQIREISTASLAWVQRHTGLTPRQLLDRVKLYAPYVDEITPHLAEEVRGIADGAGISYAEAFALQARFELTYTPAPECTVFGVAAERSAGDEVMVGQNMDLPPENEPHIILLHLVPNDGRPEILTATVCGILSQEGMNAAGLALCGSLVVSGDWRAGFPNRNFLRRYIMEQADVPAALAVLDRVTHRAASHHLVLADAAGRLVDVEQTPDTYRVFGPEAGVLVHTNHYVHPDLVPLEGLAAANPVLYRGSCRRSERLRALLAAHPDPLDPTSLHTMLADHGTAPDSICAHTGPEHDAKTVLFLISRPQSRRLLVGLGNPCESGFASYTL